jgi:hypothetical protein
VASASQYLTKPKLNPQTPEKGQIKQQACDLANRDCITRSTRQKVPPDYALEHRRLPGTLEASEENATKREPAGQIWARRQADLGARQAGRRVKVRTYLSADDCDGWESLPEGTPAATAVVAEDRARALDPVHQPDQAPHGRHLGRAPTSTCLFAGGSNKAAEVVDG